MVASNRRERRSLKYAGGESATMPIGNPMAEDTQFDERGDLERLLMVTVPVRDLQGALDFYTTRLGLSVARLDEARGWAELCAKDGSTRIALHLRKEGTGVDTGIVFSTKSAFDLHRKLVDREVRFTIRPTRVEWLGIIMEFTDHDGNRMRALESV
jgi:catechol 2,3-dioxygenase-like lactoylglutathione lyase family enzyme